MFHSRKSNNKTNLLYGRCLRIIFNDNTSYFKELLKKGYSVYVHHRNMRVLAKEPCQFVMGFSPKMFKDCFKSNNITAYHTKNRYTFSFRPVHTVLFGTESLSFLGRKAWEVVPNDMKNFSTFTVFKHAVK